MTIDNMGGAIEHWLGFQDMIGRSFMMNEDALKYPLADYLVNHGGIQINFIDLEKPHPNFSNRLVDVAVLNNTSKLLKNVFELKLAKSNTRKQVEKQRIFNDLMRLHLADAATVGKCYFIIAGKSINFQRDFRDYPNTGSSFYKKWFAFVKGQQMTFDVAGETDFIYKFIYQAFLNEYSENYHSKGADQLKLPAQITTICEFITGFTPTVVPYMAGIWSVI